MKKEELPKFHETFNPILDILSDGKIIHHRELQKRVIEKYYAHLPQDLLEQTTKSGDILIFNRIAWGKSYLKKGGYIQFPERGMVKITEMGKLQKNELKLSEIEQKTNFLEFYAEEKEKGILNNSEIKNSTPQDLIDTGFTEIETQIKNELLEKLKNIDPYYFEKFILILLKKNGLWRIF